MATRKQSGFLVQSTHGTRGNFELVVPPPDGEGLVLFWRNNDAGGFPWNGPYCFGSGNVDAACLIQSNYGSKGNLEVVVREGDRLAFYWRMDHSPWTWHGPYYFGGGTRVKGNPALIQSNHGHKGNFELIVPLVDGGMAHFWRNNDAHGLPWIGPFHFGSGDIDGVSLIQSNYGRKGNLEVVVREGNRLAFYWRMDHSPWTWHGPYYFADDVSVKGNPALIQGKHGVRGNFELVVPLVEGGLAHFWRNNDWGGFPWHGPYRFGRGDIDEVSLIQSNYGSTGNLEVVALEGDQLAFYWRMDHSPWTWHGPYIIPWLHWTRLDLIMQHQQQTQWCWAAVAASVSAFFDADTDWTQCLIVNAELGRDDCCANGGSANCNRPWYLDRSLSRTGNLQTWSSGAGTLADVMSEINDNRPLCARIGWSGGGGHFLAIDGFNCELVMVAVDDPWYGASDVVLSTFQTAYQGSGSWTHTYWVQS